ncbi:mechanosensitive ion channel protein MscS [Novimethylophilus kurashikiensis]|uniref:Mechanosensitive ion channel protein MscS n=1 Tax=Novimethylophilus kurashikiensis TaxID=1825523 RepID=A0A2R5F487_9PROT|nr:mechanosensitive ion channel protein MscS [Novimethylophilus kurashikiensis]GBG13237.1 mechanosensitive ion channel protein MscS [Novimethylophilus kurashikiensis]
MQKKRLDVGMLWPVLALILVPLAMAWLAYPSHLPPGFGIFPPAFVAAPPGFSLPIFILIALAEAAVAVFLLFPSWFGFKPVTPAPMPQKAKLPVWFWIGAAATLFFWWLMWKRVTPFGDLVYYAFSPLWWGFILTLDGLVYRRAGGKSLLASKPKTLLISAMVSIGGWIFFEYLDYFVLGNWYYPNGHMPELSHAKIVVLFLIAYTTVWPALFEWYNLLNTFPTLVARYANGPKLSLPGNLMLWGGLASVAAMVFLPYPLFWVMWIGPLAVFAGMLISNNLPSPFAALAQGNWSPMLLIALGSLFNGFFWEFWNWCSANPNPLPATNPNYWIYDIPYVNVIHICAEMPLLGFAGYLPFGILVWVLFIWAGEVFGFDSDITLD